MTIGSEVLVNGATKLKLLDNSRGTKVNELVNSVNDSFLINGCSAEGIDHYGYGLCNTDSVCDLHLTLLCKAGLNDVLRNVSCRIGCTTVNLCGVLTGECAAAVARVTAVGVNNDLTTGETCIALRTANYETAGGVNVDVNLAIDKLLRNNRKNNLVNNVLTDGCAVDLRRVLGGNNDSIYTAGNTVNVLNGYLGLTIGTKVGESAVLSNLGKSLSKLVSEGDGERHKLGGLVACVTEHKSLVACTGVKLVILAFLSLKALVNAHSNICALLVDGAENRAGGSVKAILCSVVANLGNGVTYDFLNINARLCCNFTHNGNNTGGGKCLACYTRHGILCKHLIENCVGNFVAYFVGMSFGHRLGCKENSFHFNILSLKISKARKAAFLPSFRAENSSIGI